MKTFIGSTIWQNTPKLLLLLTKGCTSITKMRGALLLLQQMKRELTDTLQESLVRRVILKICFKMAVQ